MKCGLDMMLEELNTYGKKWRMIVNYKKIVMVYGEKKTDVTILESIEMKEIGIWGQYSLKRLKHGRILGMFGVWRGRACMSLKRW